MEKRAEAGFTLVEVLIAIAVIALGFLGTASMMGGTVAGNAKAMAVSGATRMAADHLELLTGLNYANDPWLQDQDNPGDPFFGINGLRNPLPALAPGVQDRPDPGARPADWQIDSADGNYTIYWNIADNSPLPGTKTLMVIVTSTGLGPQRTVALQQVIYQ